jgi:signal transduction histidine kinase
MHFWLVKESVGAGLGSVSLRVLRLWIWVGLTLALTVLPFTEAFIPSHSSSIARIRGWGYTAYIILDLALYAYLLRDSFKATKLLIGVRKLEMQVWLVGGCVMTTTIITMMILNAITHDRRYAQLQPLVVLVFYVGTAFAITTHRIFDARQIILVTVEKIVLVTVVAGAAYAIDGLLDVVFIESVAFVLTAGIALWIAGALSHGLNRVFRFYPEATVARQAAFSVARREAHIDDLRSEFLGVLKGWGQTDHAMILFGNRELVDGRGIELPCDGSVVSVLRQMRWVTPERLFREKHAAEREDLGRFIEEKDLGVLVISEGPTLTVLIGVGVPASRRPFTYPQVTQLIELASIMESALERAHFSVKAQHAEQLATVGLLGASLAHEIRNPLVTIKTFAQLLPQNYQDERFRDKFFRLIGDEVSRIDRLTEQLMDLATPRSYASGPVNLHPVLRETVDLVAAKALDKNVEVQTDFEATPDIAVTDASAAKQVLLNLCFNAIQAMDAQSTGKWVRIVTRNVDQGIEVAVTDNGPGIAPEIRSRIFQPFQSTKSTGFGLGLAICSDILSSVKATIVADPFRPGEGATFRVTFPCPPLSS